MLKYSLYFIIVIQFSFGCNEEIGFYDTPEAISDIIHLMEKNEIGIDLYISVDDLETDSLIVKYYLINNTTDIDTIIVSSGSPVNVTYRYGEDLNNSGSQWVFPSDANVLALPSDDSILFESTVIEKVIENDYLLRAIYTFSIPEGSKKGQYWVVSNPALIKKSDN